MEAAADLTSADLIVVNGKPAFTFSGVPHLDPRTLREQNVMIDGQPYFVLSVETYALYDATGTNFGLMVSRGWVLPASYAALPAGPETGDKRGKRWTEVLCQKCGGNGVVKIPGGISQCPRCDGRCYEPETPTLGPETGDRERLRVLATPQVQDNHDYALFGSENVGPVPGGDGHSGEYDTCPHPACVLVRQAAPAAAPAPTQADPKTFLCSCGQRTILAPAQAEGWQPKEQALRVVRNALEAILKEAEAEDLDHERLMDLAGVARGMLDVAEGRLVPVPPSAPDAETPK